MKVEVFISPGLIEELPRSTEVVSEWHLSDAGDVAVYISRMEKRVRSDDFRAADISLEAGPDGPMQPAPKCTPQGHLIPVENFDHEAWKLRIDSE